MQSSDAAWGLVPRLLAIDDNSIRFFAASTLQLKLSRSWSTLPPEHHTPLKESLLTWLAQSAALSYPSAHGRPPKAGERVVLRKLAAATVSLSVRLTEWNDWLLEVIMRVSAGDGSSEGGTAREGLLEVLSVIVEQVARVDLTGQKRCVQRSQLT